jgi:hypothetical protein
MVSFSFWVGACFDLPGEVPIFMDAYRLGVAPVSEDLLGLAPAFIEVRTTGAAGQQ